MKTNIKNIAAFVAAAIWADTEFNEAEKIAVEEVSEALKLEGFKAEVENELDIIKDLDGQAIGEYLTKNGEYVDDEEIAYVFESVLQVLLCDGTFSFSEAANLLAVADALGLEHEYALLMIADMIKEYPELDVIFE